MKPIIAIQGDQASFHDAAVAQYFQKPTKQRYCSTFSSAFSAMAENQADYVLCAIENSLFGSINEVYDLLLQHDFHIIGEVYQRIEQCLIALPGASIDMITEVYSHPVALAQCEQYLNDNMPKVKRTEYHDTAASVGLLQTLQNPTVAAIAGRQAAELYGMQILASSIESHKQNYTRFVVLHRKPLQDNKANKTSLVIRTNHTPGALHAALGCFARHGINLTKLQSRPIIGNAWKYIFYLDVATSCESEEFKQAAEELESQQCTLTILGSYQSGLDG